MPISVACACGKTFDVPDEYAGKKGKCRCGRTVDVPAGSKDARQPPPSVEPGASEKETVAKSTAKKAVYVSTARGIVCPSCGSKSTKASKKEPGGLQWSRDWKCLDCGAKWTQGTPLWVAIFAILVGVGLLVGWVCLLATAGLPSESLAGAPNASDPLSTTRSGRILENLIGYGLLLVVWPLAGLGFSAYGVAVLLGKAGRTRVWQ